MCDLYPLSQQLFADSASLQFNLRAEITKTFIIVFIIIIVLLFAVSRTAVPDHV